MRRTLAVFTATAVLVPLAATAAPGAASAATNTLTVTAYDRTGATVATRVTTVNLSTKKPYVLTSGKARTLPKGTYVAMADIFTPGERSSTLGGRTVKVSGASATTIDARLGRPVDVGLSPAAAPGSYRTTVARICTPANYGEWAANGDPRNPLYVVPNGSENFRFAYATYVSEPRSAQSSPGLTGYVLAGTTKGIPAGYSRAVPRSGLARVTVGTRSGAIFPDEHSMTLDYRGGGCLSRMPQHPAGWDDDNNFRYTWPAPNRTTVHVTPGTWELSTGSNTSEQSRTLALTGGNSYSLTFFRAVYGPHRYVPWVARRVISFSTLGMVANPDSGLSDYSDAGATRSTVTLTRSGRTLKKQTRDSRSAYEFRYRISSAGWYGLTVDSRRYHPEGAPTPSWLLSPRTVAKFRFHANPDLYRTMPVHLVRFAASGLDSQNRAKAGSTTSVHLKLERPQQDGYAPRAKSTVRSVTAQVSYDNGKTWKKVGVTKSGSKWIAKVKNPGSGYVTLRAKVVDAKGNSSDITVYRAYRIA